MSLQRLLTDRITVQRPTRVETDYGYDDVWADVPGDPIHARIVPAQGNTTAEVLGGRDTLVAVADLVVPPGTDIRPTDRIRDQRDGQVWEVSSPATRITNGRRDLGLQVALRYTENL